MEELCHEVQAFKNYTGISLYQICNVLARFEFLPNTAVADV